VLILDSISNRQVLIELRRIRSIDKYSPDLWCPHAVLLFRSSVVSYVMMFTIPFFNLNSYQSTLNYSRLVILINLIGIFGSFSTISSLTYRL
jgi:hypothetical protein